MNGGRSQECHLGFYLCDRMTTDVSYEYRLFWGRSMTVRDALARSAYRL